MPHLMWNAQKCVAGWGSALHPWGAYHAPQTHHPWSYSTVRNSMSKIHWSAATEAVNIFNLNVVELQKCRIGEILHSDKATAIGRFTFHTFRHLSVHTYRRLSISYIQTKQIILFEILQYYSTKSYSTVVLRISMVVFEHSLYTIFTLKLLELQSSICKLLELQSSICKKMSDWSAKIAITTWFENF